MKQVIVVRRDLEMSVGKQIAQGAHASMGAYLMGVKQSWPRQSELEKGDSRCKARTWMESGQKKIVLAVDSEDELRALALAAHQSICSFYLVLDAGKTEVAPRTPTALAIGPWTDEGIDKITGHLPLYRAPEIIDSHDCGCPRLCGE